MAILEDIFDVRYGHSLDLNKLNTTSMKDGIAYVSRKSKDNGIAAYVNKIEGIEPGKSGELTCALSGSGVLSTFIQTRQFYTSYHVAILTPKIKLTYMQKLFYCYAIFKNQYKFSWGRQANRTIRILEIPEVDEIPNFVYKTKIKLDDNIKEPINSIPFELNTKKWKEFEYKNIFDIQKGFYNKKPPLSSEDDSIPFIGATEQGNGITGRVSLENIKKYSKTGRIDILEPIEKKLFKGNCITVSNNGSVGFAFYQPIEFTCSHDVNPLYLKNHKMNKYIAMFLISLIELEKYRWGYGRKWRPIRMPTSIIKLPVTSNNEPDWQYMENYIKSLSFSSSI